MTEAQENSTTNNSMDSSNQKDVVEKPQNAPSGDGDYPPKATVLITVACLMLTQFLVALDRTIIATAIPIITNHFNSLDDVGWYASAYLLTMSAFQLLFGRIYTFYSPKWVYISCIGLFEIGSLVCGAAPNSIALIIGRALAGMGSAGIMSGAIVIIVYLVPLEKRPAYTGIFGSVFAIASVAGPLLGGVFTDKVSWRWCFYINLPIGGVTMVALAFILRLPSIQKKSTFKEQLHRLDPIGTSLFIPAIVCLLLALQWGGTTYSWANARIIVLIILFVLLFTGFVLVQRWRQDNATVPPHIIKHRSVAAGVMFSFLNGGNMMTMVFYLPIWFQAIKGASAVHSGIMNIPAVLGLTISSMFAGFATRKIGYFTQWMYLSTVITSIAAGLICTFTVSTGHSRWIGYQAMWGLGLGFGMQQPSVAAQVSLNRKDVSTGISVVFFAQTLGGAIFVSVANNIFDNKLASGLSTIPGINSNLVTQIGATDLRKVVPQQSLQAVLVVYNLALRNAFYVCASLAAATIFGCLAMEWKSLKKAAAEQQAAAKAQKSASESAGTGETRQDRLEGQQGYEKKAEEV
ncbi:hypothetical protein LTR10_015114 [Elasticomyces elasticus]|uniref:Major facilitator superfamily (MFS) profile domain-containing protein n=1 Tax=Exophiala sideris TaxID=1016849 RepID=A0ABR0JQX1_9EURO|nr:hypothetical protein LTR10_015114 [Elasticomyces elasticus]KAK5034688.1 hypothetical protein LTR13_006344 [Exophiala sideris]KAK5039990.1 hypothetical protein LTS07_000485 [Exophiala sideris]KAK5068368.1 hypothetical protein LTR69_000486 [Exophiala sideris]KAK5187670.1 hypothetical protein LTR44_000486 [Eurotiomycetes sp. CCFEE 6388]